MGKHIKKYIYSFENCKKQTINCYLYFCDPPVSQKEITTQNKQKAKCDTIDEKKGGMTYGVQAKMWN